MEYIGIYIYLNLLVKLILNNLVSILRKGIGNFILIYLNLMLFFDEVLFVSFFKCVLSSLILCLFVKLYLFVRLILGFLICLFLCLVIIFILFKLCILYIVEVDFIVWLIKIFFCRIILSNVDFLVFVLFENDKYIYFKIIVFLNKMYLRWMIILKFVLN